VPEKFVVTFKPGKEMEERVKELERQAATVRAGRPKVNSNTEPIAQTSGTSTGYASDGSDT
jgi:hypothetical protein